MFEYTPYRVKKIGDNVYRLERIPRREVERYNIENMPNCMETIAGIEERKAIEESRHVNIPIGMFRRVVISGREVEAEDVKGRTWRGELDMDVVPREGRCIFNLPNIPTKMSSFYIVKSGDRCILYTVQSGYRTYGYIILGEYVRA